MQTPCLRAGEAQWLSPGDHSPEERARFPVGYAAHDDGSAPLVVVKKRCKHDKQGKQKQQNKKKQGTKHPAEKRPKEGLRRRKRPKCRKSQDRTVPKIAPEKRRNRRTHGRNGRERTTARNKNKEKIDQTKRARGECDLLTYMHLFNRKRREHNRTNTNNSDDET